MQESRHHVICLYRTD